MRIPLICGFMFLALVPAIRADEACSQEKVRESASKAKAVQAELLAIKFEEMDTSVPASARPRIRALKDALAATVNAMMRCETDEAVKPNVLESKLAAALDANKREPPDQPSTGEQTQVSLGVYGAHLSVAVNRPQNRPALIAIQMSFGIECGNDSMLFIYARKNGTWRPVLRWQSDGYEDISGAFGDFFQYAVVPRASDMWAVAIAHGRPWCTSRFSGFDIDVIKPDVGGGQQSLFHMERGYSRFNVEPVMRATRNGFDLRLEQNTFDIDVMTRPGIYRYQVTGNKVQRVQPIAMNGRDFVDEWLDTPWGDAARWCESANLESLRRVKEGIARLSHPKDDKFTSFTYGSVRGCSNDPKHYQVELQQDPGAAIYFQIRKGENSFTMLSASKSPDPSCRGHNIMLKGPDPQN